jgi:aspartyl-tRNA(Asn)/glutamyl-tRNA(Gln) amidotransferase subunit C
LSVAFSKEDIEHLGRLARLRTTDEEREALAAQLQRIVGYVEQLSEVDVAGVEPMTHAVPMQQRRREDATQKVVGRRALEGSAGYEDGLVRLPRIVE